MGLSNIINVSYSEYVGNILQSANYHTYTNNLSMASYYMSKLSHVRESDMKGYKVNFFYNKTEDKYYHKVEYNDL